MKITQELLDDKAAYYREKKRAVEYELKRVADAFGIHIEYIADIREDGSCLEVLTINRNFFISVNMDSMEAVKKDFLRGLLSYMEQGRLLWIYAGETV